MWESLSLSARCVFSLCLSLTLCVSLSGWPHPPPLQHFFPSHPYHLHTPCSQYCICCVGCLCASVCVFLFECPVCTQLTVFVNLIDLVEGDTTYQYFIIIKVQYCSILSRYLTQMDDNVTSLPQREVCEGVMSWSSRINVHTKVNNCWSCYCVFLCWKDI